MMSSPAAKKANIIDMAFNFTAMSRVFEKKSKSKIKSQLDITLGFMESATTLELFTQYHNEFCAWFIENIKRSKEGYSVSYGHAAKILDVVTKVYFYYCPGHCSDELNLICEFLNGAIDGPVLREIKLNKTHSLNLSNVTSIAGINKEIYFDLQGALKIMMAEDNSCKALVEYEDVLRDKLMSESK